MDFDFGSTLTITKELLLSRNSQERYMEHYLGVHVKKGLFRSPLRTDPRPTCSFYVNNRGDLIMKDFSGHFQGNFISVVMFKFNCSFHSALQIIANDFNILRRPNMKMNGPKIEYSNNKMEATDGAKIKVSIKEFSKEELKWWNSFGVSELTLKRFYVFSCEHVFLNDTLFTSATECTPIYGYYGGITDEIEKWRIYMPTKRTYRFISNWSKLMIQGSHMLPKTGEILVITKSLKDVMLLYEMGIPAIAPNSETTFLTESQLSRLKKRFTHIFLFFDNDLAGVRAMQKVRKEFDIKCIWLPRKYAKDITDYYKRFGTLKTLELIEKAKKNLIHGKES